MIWIPEDPGHRKELGVPWQCDECRQAQTCRMVRCRLQSHVGCGEGVGKGRYSLVDGDLDKAINRDFNNLLHLDDALVNFRRGCRGLHMHNLLDDLRGLDNNLPHL
jgi:hypothetical protein